MNWPLWKLSPLAATLLLAGARPAGAGSIAYSETTAAGVPLKVISIDLNDPNVKVTGQTAERGAGHSESFRAMIRRTEPVVAITGTFFSTRSLLPIGDIVIDGQLTHFGGLGTAMCVTDNNEVEFVRPAMYRHHDWSAYDFVVCSGPRLVTNGVAYVEPWSEGFHDKHMLNRNGRVAIGLTKSNQLLLVATRKPVYLSRLARAMKALGVVNAINLDGGSSIGLYYKGRTLIAPGRKLTNLIVVYDDRWQYEEMKESLLPARLRSAGR